MNENKNSREDLITLRNYTLGVVAFATAVSTLLIQVLHFRTEPTIACTLAFACMMLLIVYLIGRAENRNQLMLRDHIDESSVVVGGFEKRLGSIDDVLVDIQASALRTEMNSVMFRTPENHDTIIRMAEKYFVELGQDWVMTDTFLSWVESEEKAGRKVHVPASLLDDVTQKQRAELQGK